MIDENKHKPLSTEELLELLKKTNNDAANSMDDFEREALEGFTENGNSDEAEMLINDVNHAISKKVARDSKENQNRRIIWFSAAASLIVIFLITIFFVKESQKNSDNLALNESKNEQLIAPGMKPNEPIATSEINQTVQSDPSRVSEQQFIHSEKKKEQDYAGLVIGSVAENSSAFEQPNQNSIAGAKSGEDANYKDESVVMNTNEGLADKLEANKKEQSVREENDPEKGYQFAQNSPSSSAADEKELSKKADMDSKNTNQVALHKSKANESSTLNTATSKTSAAPSVQVNELSAYYAGGEMAIKEFVKTYWSDQKINKTLTGKFKINGNVSADGKFQVTSIVQMSIDVCKCLEMIEASLNKMTNWHPALVNGKKTESKTEFVINF